MKELLEEELQKVTAENWSKAIQHVHKLEQFIFDEEFKIDSTLSGAELEQFRFNVVYDSDSSSESESEWSSGTDDIDDDMDDELVWFRDDRISGSDDSTDSDMHSEDIQEFPAWSRSKEQ